jgi:CRISPR system Cascade subunit CasE
VAEPWQGAVDLSDVQMNQYQRLDVLRRTQRVEPDGARRGHVVAGPDVVLSGQLRVVDQQAFAHLVARGVGRHRAFGFGMLLLRPAG